MKFFTQVSFCHNKNTCITVQFIDGMYCNHRLYNILQMQTLRRTLQQNLSSVQLAQWRET